MEKANDAMITKEILNLFKETFVEVHGSYLDKGTSLFETISTIDYKKSSQRYKNFDETIAGHINHVIFYIIVLQEYITDKRTGKTDWKESWKIEKVDEIEWKKLKSTLVNEYDNLIKFIESVGEWNSSDYFGGIISILVHCAYHLGAIRQMINIEE